MSTPPISAQRLAQLADVITELAHQLDIRNPELRDVVPLTGTEIAVMREVHRHPRSTPSEIADATGLHRSNVSTTIRTLEAGGLVVRQQSPTNARSVALLPTTKAADSVAQINAYWASRLETAPTDALLTALDALESLSQISDSMQQR